MQKNLKWDTKIKAVEYVWNNTYKLGDFAELSFP